MIVLVSPSTRESKTKTSDPYFEGYMADVDADAALPPLQLLALFWYSMAIENEILFNPKSHPKGRSFQFFKRAKTKHHKFSLIFHKLTFVSLQSGSSLRRVELAYHRTFNKVEGFASIILQ